jgi:hypothetical protein
MVDVFFNGMTIPSQPNTGIAVLDTNYAPQQTALKLAVPTDSAATVLTDTAEQMAYMDAYAGPIAGVPIRLVSLVANQNDIRATFTAPIDTTGAVITHSGHSKWDFTTPTVSNSTDQGVLIQPILRFLRRLSKLNRGSN